MASSRKSRKFWIWLSIGGVLLVLILGTGLTHLVKGTTIDPNKLAKVTRGDVARSVVATGKIHPITQVEVKSKASGIVEKLYVDINDHVHKGQQLAQLDQEEILKIEHALQAEAGQFFNNSLPLEAGLDDLLDPELTGGLFHQLTAEKYQIT